MKINKYTKIILIMGSILTVAAMTLCAVCDIVAGKAGNYYLLMSYSQDFAVLSRQYIGLTALGAIVTHVIYREPEEE
ncbi:MAG: hypothetical protein IJF20_02830 [Clostridia bacterium]|nr:hypothetical protein [Oscillospiraceae bacterium]MBQ2828157.1 hypothetical protein [Clostridia bacterium]